MATSVAKNMPEEVDSNINKDKEATEDDLVMINMLINDFRQRKIGNLEMNCTCYYNVSKNLMPSCMIRR